MARLDTRASLYGEKRLTDPQVRALRAAARDAGIEYGHLGWANRDGAVTLQTVLALRRAHLVDVVKENIVATPCGHSVLAAIDAAATTRSAS